MTTQKFESEITLLRLRVPKYKEKFEKCDVAMIEEINTQSNGNLAKNCLKSGTTMSNNKRPNLGKY